MYYLGLAKVIYTPLGIKQARRWACDADYGSQSICRWGISAEMANALELLDLNGDSLNTGGNLRVDGAMNWLSKTA